MGQLLNRRNGLPGNPDLIQRNVVALSHCFPGNRLGKIGSVALHPSATYAYPPGRETLRIENSSDDPLVFE
jgi:hypothetical protein